MTKELSNELDKPWASLNFNGYRILEINYNYNINTEEHDYTETEVSIGVRFNLDLESEEKKAEIDLKAEIFPDYVKYSKPFCLSVIMRGYFTVEITEDRKKAKQLLARNAVAILFPYLRSAITSITAEAGIKPFILPPVNIVKLLEDKNKNRLETKQMKG